MENSEILSEPYDRYKIKWLVNALGFKGENGGMTAASLGFCEKNPEKVSRLCLETGGIGDVAPLIVGDVLMLEGEGCEEKKRCLCFDCEHNETTLQSLRNGYEWAEVILETKENLQNLRKKLHRVEEILEGDVGELDWNSDEITAYREPNLVLYPPGSEEEPEGNAIRL